MADEEQKLQTEILKNQEKSIVETSQSIKDLLKQARDTDVSAKEQLKLVKTQQQLEKSQATLSKDLGKNFQDMKDGLTSQFEGFTAGMLGPFGGIANSLTTGFFKRKKQNDENIAQNDALLEQAKEQTEHLDELMNAQNSTTKGIKAIAESQSNTLKLIKRQPTIESREEEERESDQQHQELLTALRGLKVDSIKDVGDDGGFFAGLGGIASILGGIAMGLTAPGIFTNMSQWAKAFDNFKVKFPNFTAKIGTWWDDLAGSFKKFKFPDMPKFPKIKWPDLPKIKLPDFPKLPDMPKIPENFLPKFDTFKTGFREFFNIPAKEIDATKDALKVLNAADFGYDAVRISAETFGDTTKLVARNAKGHFVKVSDELKAAMTLADEGGDAGKVAARARSFMGIELPGFMQKSIDKIDEVAKGADVAVDAAKTGGLAAKVGGIAKFLTVGVAGRALSIAGNPVFDVIAMGKDVFDIANAVTDDDVKSAVKNEDIGALVGGFIGGAIGIVGGPAGVALGMGLGNMAGEFIGQAMDDPEIVGAIKQVEDNLKAERAGLKEEIATLGTEIDTATKANNAEIVKFQKEIAEAKAAGNATEAAELTRQLEERKVANADKIKALTDEKNAREARDKEIVAEQAKIQEEVAPIREELLAIEKRANKINADKAALELKIAAAEERGDSAMVARLQNRVTILDEEFDKADADYQVQAEKLRKTASATSGALADQTNSFFDKMVTEGGFFGNILGSVSKVATLWGGEGFGMKGEGGKKYLAEAMKKIEGQIAEQQALIDAGDDFDWALEPRKNIIAKLERERGRLSTVEVEKAASGGVVVTKPTYLPGSGVVVGEHPSWSGRGAFSGGVPVADGPQEAIIPLHEASEFIDPMGRSVAGAVLNRMAVSRVGMGMQTGGAPSAPVVMDNSTMITNNNTTTTITNPIGQMLPGESDDFVHKVA